MSMGEYTGDIQMKEFISVTNELIAFYTGITHPESVVLQESAGENISAPIENPILEECRNLVFKLRSFMESSGGEYGLGVEMGMQRAAEMIDNLIRRHERGDDVE
jgi:hypothetical protein